MVPYHRKENVVIMGAKLAPRLRRIRPLLKSLLSP